MLKEKKSAGRKIVNAINTALKIDDKSRIEKFFVREEKLTRNYISDLRANLVTLCENHNRELKKLKDRAEDAYAILEEARLDVDPSKLKTTKDMENFSNVYWKRVKAAKSGIDRISHEKDKVKKDYDDTITTINSQLRAYLDRLDLIS